MTKLYVATLFAMTALWGTGAAAVTDAEKCEAAKNKLAGKYAFCRQKAEAKAIKTGDPADYSKCDANFSAKWAMAETDGGGMCPTTGDGGAIAGLIAQRTTEIATALTGLPTCGGGGVFVGISCWYLSALGESCDTACFVHGKTYSSATDTYAGASGTLAHCQAVMLALGDTHTFVDQGSFDGFGCARSVSSNQYFRVTNQATTSTALAAFAERACACN